MVSAVSPKKQTPENVLLRWLSSRQELIVAYTNLAGKVKGKEISKPEELERFGEQMVDYLSEGHFEVYELLQAKSAPVPNLSQIYQTTDIAMAFHDKYFTEAANCSAWQQLPDDFSTLGEALTIRFELEDRMISNN